MTTPLLLVHAFPLDARLWDREVEALSGDRRVLAPSLPGFGASPSAGGVMTMDAAADFLAAQLDEAGIDRAVVAGTSMGGYVAFSMWRRHRDRIAGLGLVDTRAEADDEEGKARRRAAADLVLAKGSDAIADSPPPLLSDAASDELWDRVKAIIREQPPEAIAAASLGMAERPDSRSVLAEIDVPTLVAVGADDKLTPPPLSQMMAAEIPGAEIVVLEGAGHLSNLEAPEPFLEALRGLLRRVD